MDDFEAFVNMMIIFFAVQLLLPVGLVVGLSVLFSSILPSRSFINTVLYPESKSVGLSTTTPKQRHSWYQIIVPIFVSGCLQVVGALIVIGGNVVASVCLMVIVWWFRCGQYVEGYASFFDYYERANSLGWSQIHLFIVTVAAICGLITGLCVYTGSRLWFAGSSVNRLLKIKGRGQKLILIIIFRMIGSALVFFGFIFILGVLSFLSFALLFVTYEASSIC